MKIFLNTSFVLIPVKRGKILKGFQLRNNMQNPVDANDFS